MKLEQQVVSLKLAKQLKELGVKQNSLFYWARGITKSFVITRDCEDDAAKKEMENYSAFTVAELGREIVKVLEKIVKIKKRQVKNENNNR